MEPSPLIVMKFLFFAAVVLLMTTRADTETRPRAIVHIGPPKTGTSYIQSMISSPAIAARMREDNLYWPATPTTTPPYYLPLPPKGVADLAIDMVSKGQSKCFNYSMLPHPAQDIKRFLNESRSKGRNVLLSAENFISMGVDVAEQLRDEVLAGFDITIVLVYREWISLCKSLYFQKQKFLPTHTTSFSTFLMQTGESPRHKDQGLFSADVDRMVQVGHYMPICHMYHNNRHNYTPYTVYTH
jgi:hypothetical protein